MHQIVVVGGGAGGLELVTRLSKYSNKRWQKPNVAVTLVDMQPTHLWKPLLHEVAAGTINVAFEQLEYVEQAKSYGFQFQQGALKALNRKERLITIAPVLDSNGEEYLPERQLSYDTLVLALGSVTNFFDVPGAEKYSFALDTATQAEDFRQRFMRAYQQIEHAGENKPLCVTIVGAGATGVELAAELHHTVQVLMDYGSDRSSPRKKLKITIIEAATRVLPALQERISLLVSQFLGKLSISIKVDSVVTQVDERYVQLSNQETIDSDLVVWAAGIKAPSITQYLDGLTTNRNGQILVTEQLQSVADSNIFALGDCASCPWLGQTEGTQVPPRAQAAHQQSSFLLKRLKARIQERGFSKKFQYRDFGSLISLGHITAVGNLFDGITRRGFIVRGWVARWMYWSLYRIHTATLRGWFRMSLDTVGQWFRRLTRPRIKLH